jgi:hypothetical protein
MGGNSPHINYEILIASSQGLAEVLVVHSTTAVGAIAASCHKVVNAFFRFLVKYGKYNAADISKSALSSSKSYFACNMLCAPSIAYRV